jgi:hypothetical protein
MGTKTLACAAALSFAASACGGSDSDNVMAQQANALSPEQVDLALGPEIANTGGNELEATNDMNAINSLESDNAADSVPTDNNSSEE